jgi:adenylylsulfate kinase
MTGPVIWITGLSGSGKTTLALEVSSQLRKLGLPVMLLDGDVLREIFDQTRAYESGDRLSLAFKYSRLCQSIASQGIAVVIATISLFSEIHSWNRKNHTYYFEIFLNVGIQELRRRDSKGLYRAFDAGEISDIAGLDLPVDYPENPDITIEDNSSISISDLAAKLIKQIHSKGLVNAK